MLSLYNSDIEFLEITFFHAKPLSILHQACFQNAWSLADFNELLILPNVYGVIASEVNQTEDSFIGFVLCSVTHEECEILTLGVMPDWRHQGVGYVLLEQVLAKMEYIDVQRIFLEVAENNNAARKLYFTQGFKEIGHRSNYYRQSKGRVDAIRLVKKI
jgi:ribosomal-protein-alanine N-acetyltransferase